MALRCLQRLSVPDTATQRCPWRDNWDTGGPSARVLSYYGQLSSRFLRPHEIETDALLLPALSGGAGHFCQPLHVAMQAGLYLSTLLPVGLAYSL